MMILLSYCRRCLVLSQVINAFGSADFGVFGSGSSSFLSVVNGYFFKVVGVLKGSVGVWKGFVPVEYQFVTFLIVDL